MNNKKDNSKNKYIRIFAILFIIGLIIYYRNEIKNIIFVDNLVGGTGNMEVMNNSLINNKNLSSLKEINNILEKFN
jgi:hypothetical protein